MTDYRSLAQAILAHGQETPDRVALRTENESYTYRELSAGIRRTAVCLRDRGLRKGDRVIAEAGFTYAYVCACYGTHLAGGIFTPVEADAPDSRILEMDASVEAALIVTNAAREGIPAGITLETLAAESAGADPDGELPAIAPEDPAEMLFTTGTTGKSKGVLVSHKNQVTMAKAGIESTGLQEDAVWLICTPMNHAGGLRKMHMALYRGCTVSLLDGFQNMKRFFDVIERQQVTAIYLPPSAIHMLLALGKKRMAAWDGQLRFIYSSSAVYPRKDKDQMKALLPHVRMYNVYGGSEVGIVCSLDFNSGEDREGSVGKPHSYAKVVILDKDYQPMEHTDAEHYGLLAVESDSVMMGYWREEELTAGVLRDGRLVMSDNAYLDADGNVILIGRSGDVINLGGCKIAPNEVEEIARTLPGVDDAMLILSGNENAPYLKLLYTAAENSDPDEIALIAALRAKLEPYKVPKRLQRIDRIEKTFNGKPDRKKMIALYR